MSKTVFVHPDLPPLPVEAVGDTMTDDLTAAHERHVKNADPHVCRHDPLNWPCDAARFRDRWARVVRDNVTLWTERDAARALADELVKALKDHEDFGCEAFDLADERLLDKWEASRK